MPTDGVNGMGSADLCDKVVPGRVLLQNLTYYPSQGGVDSYMYNLARGNPNTQFTVEAVMTAVPRERVLANLEVRDVGKRLKVPQGLLSVIARIDPALLTLLLSHAAVSRDVEADLVICRHPAFYVVNRRRPAFYLFATALPRYLKALVHGRSHGVLKRCSVAVKSWIYGRLERRILETSPSGVLSRKKAEELSQEYGIAAEDVSVVPPGVDTKRFSFLERSITSRPVRIVVVARLSPEKNIDLLIRAAACGDPDFCFDIVGDGPDRDRLEQLSADRGVGSRVQFHGFAEDVRPFLAAAHVFVLPSKYEGFGHVLLEAMSTGLPCVALDPARGFNVASAEIVSEGRNGVLVGDDPAELLDAVRWIARSQGEYQSLSRTARLTAERFCWHQHLASIHGAFLRHGRLVQRSESGDLSAAIATR